MKEKAWIVAAFVLTFAAGVLVGAIIVRRLGPPLFAIGEFGEPDERRFPMHGERPPLPSLEMLERQLKLNEAQQRQVAAIVERHRAQMHEHLSKIRPATHELLNELRAEIESVLTPEQLEKFRREFPRRERRFGSKHAPRDSMLEKPE